MDDAGDFRDFMDEPVSGRAATSGYDVYAQRYNSAGVAQGSEVLVNTYTTNSQIFPSVAMNATGDFVIALTSIGQDGGMYAGGIFAQRFDAAGSPVGTEFEVNSYTSSNQWEPSVAMDAAGDMVITWSSFGEDGQQYGIYAQLYNAAGIAQGGEFEVNTFTLNLQVRPLVAMRFGRQLRDCLAKFRRGWIGIWNSRSARYQPNFLTAPGSDACRMATNITGTTVTLGGNVTTDGNLPSPMSACLRADEYQRQPAAWWRRRDHGHRDGRDRSLHAEYQRADAGSRLLVCGVCNEQPWHDLHHACLDIHDISESGPVRDVDDSGDAGKHVLRLFSVSTSDSRIPMTIRRIN